MEAVLLTFGIVCLVAAVVGGGLKASAFEIGAIENWRPRLGLALLGALLIAGAVLVHFPGLLAQSGIAPPAATATSVAQPTAPAPTSPGAAAGAPASPAAATAQAPEPSKSEIAAAPATPTSPPPSSRCALEASAQSLPNGTAVSLAFQNASHSERHLFWITPAGTRQLFEVIGPGGSYAVGTYAYHPWVISDSTGRCLDLILPENVRGPVILRDVAGG
jgi:hypothetical protein